MLCSDTIRRLFKNAIFVLTLVVIIGCNSTDNTQQANNTTYQYQIIFESTRDAPHSDPDFRENPQKYVELYIMDSDGGNVRRLTYNSFWEHKPEVSPDGTKILISIHYTPGRVNETDPGWEIAVMNIDGTGLTRLTENDYLDINAKWNHDGTKIVYMSDSNKRNADDLKRGFIPQYDIYVMNPDGTGKTRLTYGTVGELFGDPCFSLADEDIIYYIHSAGFSGNFDLWRMRADGTNKELVLSHNDSLLAINDPMTSPDGKTIIFEAKVYDDGSRRLYNIFTIDRNGRNLKRITLNDGEADIWPHFSLDGSKIVYFTYIWSDGGHTQQIRISNPDGTDEINISSYPWDAFPSWIPQ